MIARLVVCAVLALPAGWFAGVLADRVPDREPLFQPLKPVHLGGRDLALHIGVLALFGLAAWRFQDSSWGVVIAYCAFFGVLATLSAIDMETYRLPDLIVLPSLVASVPVIVVLAFADDDTRRIRYALVGAAIYFGFLFLAHLISPRGMGFGDVKLAALMGLYVGWLGGTFVDALALVLWAMLIGFAIGTIVGVVLLATRRRNQPFPFGPFLALGAILAILASQSLVTG